jgi:hypothetical protein
MGHLILKSGRSVVFNESFYISEENQKAIAVRLMEFVSTVDFQPCVITKLATNINGQNISFRFFSPADCNIITVISVNQETRQA